MSKHDRIPGMHNGGSAGPLVPPDLPYPVTIYQCSGAPEHDASCDGNCDSFEPTESQVKLQNIAREYARNNMSFLGIPLGSPLPQAGIKVDLVEVICRLMTIEEIVFELVGMTREEYDEKYRETKIEFLQDILDSNKEQVKKQQVANALGIVEPKLLGPDGSPIG